MPSGTPEKMIDELCAVERQGDGTIRLVISSTGRTTVLNTPVMESLLRRLEALSSDEHIRALVLTTPGERTFIAGADLRELVTFDTLAAERFISTLRDVCEAIRHFPVPVIARIGGWCLGGGLELAMACDLRIASSAAHFAMPEVRVGIPSVIHAALLPRLVGWGRARWLILTGATLDASTALSWGLIDAVAEPAALDAAMEQALAPILDCGPQVIRAQKTLLREWEELPLRDSIRSSIPAFGKAFATGEPQTYMNRFFAKRTRHD